MGNCQSNSQHHVRVSTQNPESPETPIKRILEDRERKDVTDSTESDREADSVTLPLSPDSNLSLLSPGSSYALSPTSSRDYLLTLSPSQQQISYNLAEAKKPKYSPYGSLSSGSPPRPKGRALQNRLEKARHMQMALSQSASNHSLGSNASFSITSHSSLHEDDASSQQRHQQLPAAPYRFSMSAETSHSNEQLNEEFEATISRATIWAEVESFDKVFSVALSRQKPSLNQITPQLFLAVGTEDGSVTVQEVLDDSPISTTTFVQSAPTTDSNVKRLGESISVHRQGRIRSIDFSPDGRFMAVGGDDCACAIFTLDIVQSMDGSEALRSLDLCAQVQRVDRVYSVQFSPDGRYLAVGGFDGSAAIIAVDDIHQSDAPDVIAEIAINGLIFTLDWSPDSRYLAIGGSDKCCSVVDVAASWQVFREIKRPSSVQTVKWHPTNGRYLAIGSGDVAIVDRESFKTKQVIDLKGQANAKKAFNRRASRSVDKINALCWSPNGSYLVICDSEQVCTLVEGKSFTPVHEVRRGGNVMSAVWGQQSTISGLPRRYLVLGGEDRKVVILKAGLEISAGASSMGDDLSASASSYFSNRGEWTLKENAFRDVDEAITAPSGNPIGSANQLDVTCIAFSRGSKSRPSLFWACATDDGIVTIRSTTKWGVVSELAFPKPIISLTFSNGSKYLALACEDSTVYIVEIPSFSVIVAKEIGSPILSVVFSKNNERLAVGTADGILSLLDPNENWDSCGEIESNDSPVLSLDWSTKFLVIGRQDGSVSIYDSDQVCSNFCVAQAEFSHKAPVRSVAFGISSRFLAVGGDDGCLSLYSAKGGWVNCHQVRAEHSISTIKWSPTGRFVAFGGEGGTLQVIDTIFWAEVEEAKELVSSGANKGNDVSISSLAFSQDGNLLAYGGHSFGASIVNLTTWDIAFFAHKVEDLVEESSISSSEDHIDGISLT